MAKNTLAQPGPDTPRRRHPGGRPRKYGEPSRPVTVTLPESTLAQLAGLDPDRGRAIVKAIRAALPRETQGLTELVEVLPGTGILLTGPSRYLGRIAWLHLVEIAPGRFLLALPKGTTADSLAIALIDLLETISPKEPLEYQLISTLIEHLRSFRQGGNISQAEILLVAMPR